MKLAARIAATLALAAVASWAQAQGYPSKVVTLIVPYPPGGGTDVVGRSLAQALSRHWGQPVVVENVTGADGVIGTQRMLRASPDGYTLLMPASQSLLWKVNNPQAKIDVQKDFRLVSKIGDSPLAIAVPAKFPAANMKELVAQCQKENCALGSGAASSELIGRHLLDVAGIRQGTLVPYKGTAPMITDLIGGHIQMGIAPVTAQLMHHKNGTLKVIGIVSKERALSMPDVPTLEQQGFPVYGTGWYGLAAARQTPQAVFDAITSAVQAVAQNEALRASIVASGSRPVFSTPEAFTQDVQREIDYLAPILAKYPPTLN